MISNRRNYAFIDSQNLHLGIQSLGWKLDYAKFRVYLREKYGVERAYLFIGFVPNNQSLYDTLQHAGFILKFKPTTFDARGHRKGNVDADLVLTAMLEFDDYENAVIVSNDGDFYSLVQYLYSVSKFEAVVSPNKNFCAKILCLAAHDRLQSLNDLKKKLAYKMKRTT